MLPLERLDALLRRRDFVEAELASGPDAESYVALARELSELDPVAATIRQWQAAREELAGVEAMIAEPAMAGEMAEMAEEERKSLVVRLADLETAIKLTLIPKDAADEKSAILEVRAGTGGDEASLFAGDLFRMYMRYADLQGWKTEILSESEGTMGGYKEAAMAIRGKGVFARLKFESGVHRVQRVPETEARNTSTLRSLSSMAISTSSASGSTSTPPTAQLGSPIFPPALPWRCRLSGRSTRTGPKRWRCCAPVSTRLNASGSTAPAQPTAATRSDRVIAPSASALIIFRKGGSPTTASA